MLGVGNTLLGDDGIGVHMIHRLSGWIEEWHGLVELIEGGTMGLALLGPISGRSALVLLDAVRLGSDPGTIHVREDREVLSLRHRSDTAHESNAGELLAAALLLGELPDRLLLIGIEPARLDGAPGLSKIVEDALPAALDTARAKITELISPRAMTQRAGI